MRKWFERDNSEDKVEVEVEIPVKPIDIPEPTEPTYMNPLTDIQKILIVDIITKAFIDKKPIADGHMMVTACFTLLSTIFFAEDRDELKIAITDYILAPSKITDQGVLTEQGFGLGLAGMDFHFRNLYDPIERHSITPIGNWYSLYGWVSPENRVKLTYFWQDDFNSRLKGYYDDWVAMGAPVNGLSNYQTEEVTDLIMESANDGKRRIYLGEILKRLNFRAFPLSYFQWVTLTDEDDNGRGGDIFEDTLKQFGFIHKELNGVDELTWDDEIAHMNITVYYEFKD